MVQCITSLQTALQPSTLQGCKHCKVAEMQGYRAAAVQSWWLETWQCLFTCNCCNNPATPAPIFQHPPVAAVYNSCRLQSVACSLQHPALYHQLHHADCKLAACMNFWLPGCRLAACSLHNAHPNLSCRLRDCSLQLQLCFHWAQSAGLSAFQTLTFKWCGREGAVGSAAASSHVQLSSSARAFIAGSMSLKDAMAYFMLMVVPYIWTLGVFSVIHFKLPKTACRLCCKSCQKHLCLHELQLHYNNCNTNAIKQPSTNILQATTCKTNCKLQSSLFTLCGRSPMNTW